MKILKTGSHLKIYIFFTVVYDAQGMQIVCAIVSILCFVLRETPENAELVETVIFHESVDIISLLQNGHDLLRWILMDILKMKSISIVFSSFV